MKMAIVVRTDLDMGKGKIAAQASHAAVEAFSKVNKLKGYKWKISGQKKIVLKVDGVEELNDIVSKAKKAKVNCSIIRDAGLTQLKPGTTTAIALGPDEDTKIDGITSYLKLL